MEQNKKVAILLSSYNGEKYIEEQINSILNQTYKNIEIYVRDDESTDNTSKILKKYQENNKIKFISGKNVGFIQSFMLLLKECNNANYYAFCDQDDVWYEDKIERAVMMLENEDNNIPLLYASNYDYYNSNMEFISHSSYKFKKPTFQKSIIECIAPGMTMVINKKLRNIIEQNVPKQCAFHDWWIYQVCSAFGKVIYDNKVTVKYRRHKKNVSEEESGIIKQITKVIKRKSFSNVWGKLKKQLIEFNEIYSSDLKEKDKKILQLFINEKFKILNYFKKIFYFGRYKDNLKEEIMIRIMFIINII